MINIPVFSSSAAASNDRRALQSNQLMKSYARRFGYQFSARSMHGDEILDFEF